MRTSNVSEKEIISACRLAKKNDWTINDAAKSVGMEGPAFRSRVNAIKKVCKDQITAYENKGKQVSLSDTENASLDRTRTALNMLSTCFRDGRGHGKGAKSKSVETTVSMISDLFAGLDDEIENDTEDSVEVSSESAELVESNEGATEE